MAGRNAEQSGGRDSFCIYVDKAGDIELQEIAKSTENLIFQIKDAQTDTDELFEHPLRELLGLDAQLRSIRGSLKVEVAKRFSWKSTSRKSVESSRNFKNIPEFTMTQREKTSPSELMI